MTYAYTRYFITKLFTVNNPKITNNPISKLVDNVAYPKANLLHDNIKANIVRLIEYITQDILVRMYYSVKKHLYTIW